jgi:hypothetical protein
MFEARTAFLRVARSTIEPVARCGRLQHPWHYRSFSLGLAGLGLPHMILYLTSKRYLIDYGHNNPLCKADNDRLYLGCGVRNSMTRRSVFVRLPYPLAWLVLAPGYSPELSGPCGVEAQVLIERIGPQGTSAGDIPGSSGLTVAVTLTLRRTCWAAGGNSLSEAPGPRGSNRLLVAPKKVD